MFTKSFYSSSLCHFAYSESRLLLSHVYAYDVYRCIARVQCTRIISMYGLVYTNLWMFCGSVTNTCIKIWWDETSRVCLPLNCTNWETQTHAHTTHSSILQNHRKTINVCFKTINPVKSVFIRERKRARARVSLWFCAQLNHFEQQPRNNKNRRTWTNNKTTKNLYLMWFISCMTTHCTRLHQPYKSFASFSICHWMQTDEWMDEYGWLVALWSAKIMDFDFDFESDAGLLNCIGCACVRAYVRYFCFFLLIYWPYTIKLIKHSVKCVFAQQHYRMQFLFRFDLAGVVVKFKNKWIHHSHAEMTKKNSYRAQMNVNLKKSILNESNVKFDANVEVHSSVCWYRRADRHNVLRCQFKEIRNTLISNIKLKSKKCWSKFLRMQQKSQSQSHSK